MENKENPEPITPISPVDTGANEEKKPVDKKLVIGGIAAAVVVVLVILGAIFIPKMFGTDYGKTYDVTVELDGQLRGIYEDKSGACYKMSAQIASESVSTDKFNGYADDCKKQMVEAHDKIAELGKTSGVKNDEELKDKFEAFAEKAEVSLPDAAKLAETMDLCKQIHAFMVAVDDISVDSSVEDVKKAAEPLVNSNNKTWSEFATKWRDFMIQILELVQEQQKNGTTTELYNRYKKVYSEYEEWMEEAGDIADSVPVEFDEDASQEMLDAFTTFSRAVSTAANK